MPQNKAAQALENLASMEVRAESAEANLAKLDDTRRGFPDLPDEGEASFSMPEGVATAVAAGWLLGPVGGVLLGIAQGIMGKREEQAALDAFAADSDAMREINAIYDDQFDRLAANAQSEEDIDQLSAMQAERDAAIRMSLSGSPEMRQKGMDLMTQVGANLNAFSLKNEEQRIASEAAQAQRARDLSKDQMAAHDGLLADYDSQSANYETIVQNSAIARELINRGHPVDIVAALIQVNKALDPTSVVRPEEAKALGNVGTLVEQMQTKVNEWAGSGVALSDPQRKELMQLVDTIENTARGFQMQRDIRFQERAVDRDLPAKYVNDFRRVNDLPAFDPGEFQSKDGSDANITEIIEEQAGQFSTAPFIERNQRAHGARRQVNGGPRAVPDRRN